MHMAVSRLDVVHFPHRSGFSPVGAKIACAEPLFFLQRVVYVVYSTILLYYYIAPSTWSSTSRSPRFFALFAGGKRDQRVDPAAGGSAFLAQPLRELHPNPTTTLGPPSHPIPKFGPAFGSSPASPGNFCASPVGFHVQTRN